MAIAFRSVGTATKVDTSVTGTSPTVAMAAGHTTNDLLLMPVFTDNNTAPATPSGWTRLFYLSAGTSANSPYQGWSHVALFYRIDNGALGSSVTLSLDSSPWPTGLPYVLAWITAYSGCDTASPIGEWGTSTTQSSTAAQAHPSITTALANCWLVTLRGIGSDNARTFTDSVGTDVERIDTDAGFPASPSAAQYDSNTALSAGAQTVRTTTASATVGYGSSMASIVLRPAAVAGTVVATAQTASVSFTAKAPAVTSTAGPWNACTAGMPDYFLGIDWNADGDFSDPGEEITPDEVDDVVISYGRDQTRQLSPASVGTASLRLVNVDRSYSPENPAGPLYGNLDPARDALFQVTWATTVYPLFKGKIDDFDVHADFGDRNVSFTFLDRLSLLQNVKLSTPLYQTVRTGDVINVILDEAGWTGPRDVDPGATVIPFWWVEGTDALTAVQDIVKSEGPPAVAYQAPDGTFIFRDRHHRLLQSTSQTSQATFAQSTLADCASPPVTGFGFTAPFVYSNGWKDIVNAVSFSVDIRQPDLSLSAVWSSTDTISLTNGESRVIDVSGSDPFINAVTPLVGTDFTLAGAGTLTVLLSRTSGVSAQITLTAVGGSVQVLSMQLRAQAIKVVNTVKVTAQDAVSISQHGEKDYPDAAPWAGVNDAYALASLILTHYAQRLPTVRLRVPSTDPAHWQQVMTRTLGDRITITYGELGLSADFFVESVTHTIQRIWTNKPPVHAVVLGCEKVPTASEAPVNPFTFDKRGSGFDQGVFDPITSDDPHTIWIWDDPVQGTFDGGLFAT
jgi:hypothetical protein